MNGSTFVRAAFYVKPPTKDAPQAEWEAWINLDNKAAIQAKRAYTKSCPAQELPANAQGVTARKINGVWKASTNIGYVGGEDVGHLEPAVEATQDRDPFAVSARGVSHARSGNNKRKARRDRRRAKRMGF